MKERVIEIGTGYADRGVALGQLANDLAAARCALVGVDEFLSRDEEDAVDTVLCLLLRNAFIAAEAEGSC